MSSILERLSLRKWREILVDMLVTKLMMGELMERVK